MAAEGEYVFDMGPTVITVPQFIEELFRLEVGRAELGGEDFPPAVRGAERVRRGESGGPATQRYVQLRPILPFYRIYFDDGTYFDYDGDPESTRRQIGTLAPEDLGGYERFHTDARLIFERGFLELGYTHFGDVGTMLRVVPDLMRLDAVRTLFSFVGKYFSNPKMQQVFSFETLLVGGNPLSVPAIYAMIHFVEKTWGIHYALGGTGALVRAFVRKFEELGGTSAAERGRRADSGGRPPARKAAGARRAAGERRGTERRRGGQQRRLGQHQSEAVAALGAARQLGCPREAGAAVDEPARDLLRLSRRAARTTRRSICATTTSSWGRATSNCSRRSSAARY